MDYQRYFLWKGKNKMKIILNIFALALFVLPFSNISIAKEINELEIIEREYVTLADYEKLGNITCKNAELYSKVTNRLSNMYSQALEPFYSQREKDFRRLAITNLQAWNGIQLEKKSNDLKRKRNEAWVKLAECLYEQGKTKKALNTVFHALDYINSKQDAVWKRAFDLMLKIINS